MILQGWDKTIKILTIIFCIYPIFPLAAANTYALALLITLTIESQIANPIPAPLYGWFLAILFFFWNLGLPVGFVMLIRALFQKKSSLDFWLLIYGGICYSSFALIQVVGIISAPLPLDISTMFYKASIDNIAIKIIYLSYWLISITPFIWYVWANYKSKKSLEVRAGGAT